MVVFFVRDLTGGIRRHVVSILLSFAKEPENTLIVTNLAEADYAFQNFLQKNPQFQSRVVDVKVRRAPHIADLWQMTGLYRRLRREPSRLVFHGHGAKGGMQARILGRLLKARTIYTPHGGSIHQMHGKFGNFVYRMVEKILYYFSDQIVFESKYSQSVYEKIIHSKSDRLILNYNGIAFPAVEPHFVGSVNSGGSVASHRLKMTEFRMGAFGALRFIKGFDLLIEAVSLLRNDGIPVTLSVYGEGEERDSLCALAEKRGVVDFVRIGVDTQNVDASMRECDLVVQPSRFESFGYTALEAVANRVPVIVSNAGGLVEIIEDQKGGLVFSSNDVVGLAQAIKKLYLSPELGHKYAEEAYTRAVRLFDEQIMVENLKRIYFQ